MTFTATYKDYDKNTRLITATTERVDLRNQHNISLGLTHLTHLIKPADRRRLNGNAAESAYLRDLFLTSAANAKNNNEFIKQINSRLSRPAFN